MHKWRALAAAVHLGLSPLDLAFQVLERLVPDRLDRVIFRGDVDIGTRDG